MIATLSYPERRMALALSLMLAFVGLVMAGVTRSGPMSVHGWMAFVLGVLLAFKVGGSLFGEPEPGRERLLRYYDAPIKFGIGMTLVWAIIGMGVGVWVAALMYWPEATPL